MNWFLREVTDRTVALGATIEMSDRTPTSSTKDSTTSAKHSFPNRINPEASGKLYQEPYQLMTTVLAVETSCDETAVAIVKDRHILSSIVSSQIDLHVVTVALSPKWQRAQHLETVNQRSLSPFQKRALIGRRSMALRNGLRLVWWGLYSLAPWLPRHWRCCTTNPFWAFITSKAIFLRPICRSHRCSRPSYHCWFRGAHQPDSG